MLRLLPAAVLLVLAGSHAVEAAETDTQPCNAPGVTAPVALTPHVPPLEMYPPLSVAMGESGATMVHYVVRPTGDVSDVAVSASSGSLRLDDAAVAFVQGFRFKPPTKDGQPTACSQTLNVTWTLRQPQAPPNPNVLGGAIVRAADGDFPPDAKAHHESGVMVAMVVLDDKGAIELIQPVSETPFGDLNSASIALLRRQKLAAATVNGQSTRTLLLVRVVWAVAEQPGAAAQSTQNAPLASGQNGTSPPAASTDQRDTSQNARRRSGS